MGYCNEVVPLVFVSVVSNDQLARFVEVRMFTTPLESLATLKPNWPPDAAMPFKNGHRNSTRSTELFAALLER